MKYLIILLLLASCSKSERCWTCTTTFDYSTPKEPTVIKRQVCDKTKAQIKDYEKATSGISGAHIMNTDCN